MGKRRNGLLVARDVAVLALVAAACGDDDGGGETGSTTGASGATALSGTITISGSSTVQPITSLVAELFNEDVSSDVAITVDGPGTGDGFVLFCDGETDIQDASRTIEDEEKTACDQNGIEYVELAVAFDGITVMTNPANGDVTCLNQGDLYALFGPESDGIDTWNGADSLAQQVGGTGGFPTRRSRSPRPGRSPGPTTRSSSSPASRTRRLSQGVPEDKAATLRTDYHSSPDDNAIITAMEGSDTPLGFVGFAFAENAGDQVKILQVDGGERVHRAEPRHDRRPVVPAVAHAVHLREQGQALRPRHQGLRRLLPERQRHRRRRPADGLRRSAVRPDRVESVDVDLRVGWYRSDRQLVADHVGTGPGRASRPVPSATLARGG